MYQRSGSQQSRSRFRTSPEYVQQIQKSPKPPAPVNYFLQQMRAGRAVPRPYSRPLEEELTWQHQPHLQQLLWQQLPYAQAGVGQGIRTRGWRAAAPKRGSQRHLMHQICGDKCFLMPDEEKFPICPSCPPGDRTCGGCVPDCRGISAAKMRAAQWRYPQVYQQATELQQEFGCPLGRRTQRALSRERRPSSPSPSGWQSQQPRSARR